MPHPLVRSNPAWTNAALLRHWDALERLVGPRRMPVVDEHTAHRLVAVEYGSGAYGTVMPTRTKGLVLKVTSDPTEAKIAAVALTLRPYPSGLVRYRAVLRLSGRHGGNPIYALWREEAYDVGKALDRDERAIGQLETIRDQADEAFRLLYDDPRARSEVASAAERCAGATGFEGGRDPGVVARVKRWSKGRAASAGCGVDAARVVADEMSERGRGRWVGATIRDLIDRGILLADVHPGNVGSVPRGGSMRVVITDPGHATFLTDEFDRVEPMGLADRTDGRIARSGRRFKTPAAGSAESRRRAAR